MLMMFDVCLFLEEGGLIGRSNDETVLESILCVHIKNICIYTSIFGRGVRNISESH